MIAIIDYDAGNLKSVEKAFLFLGEKPVVSRDAATILKADKVVLPGVGSFGDAMGKLQQFGLVKVIREVAEKGTPLFGICLGLQLFFESSEESTGVEGLGLLPGKVVRFPERKGMKVPHMGWNSLEVRPDSVILKGIDSGAYVYFVHSYYLQAAREEDVAAASWYGMDFHGAVERGNLFACQFHPEKSGDVGLHILKNFIELT